MEPKSFVRTTHSGLLALAILFSTSGCAKQIADFVDKARDEGPVVPKLNTNDEDAPKISPARIDAKGTAHRMEANFTMTNRELKGTTIRASVTTGRTSTSN